MDWQPMETAPRDGTAIRLLVDGAAYVCAWWGGLLDSDGKDCAGWQIASEEEPPEDWDDGVCWEFSASGTASTKPTAWKAI